MKQRTAKILSLAEAGKEMKVAAGSFTYSDGPIREEFPEQGEEACGAQPSHSPEVQGREKAMKPVAE